MSDCACLTVHECVRVTDSVWLYMYDCVCERVRDCVSLIISESDCACMCVAVSV